MLISRNIYKREANLLYWKENYAPSTNIPRFVSDITKHDHEHQIFLRCLCHFRTDESFARHKELCIREDLMSVLHVLSRARLQTGAIEVLQLHIMYYGTVCNLCGLRVYSRAAYLADKADYLLPATQIVRRSGRPLLDSRHLQSVDGDEGNRKYDRRVFGRSHRLGDGDRGEASDESTDEADECPEAKKYENATKCYICRQPFEEDDPKGPKVRDHDHITEFFIGVAQRQCNLKRPVSFQIPVFFHNFRGYDAHVIVNEFGKRPDRVSKLSVRT